MNKCLYCSQPACVQYGKDRNVCLLHYSRSKSILHYSKSRSTSSSSSSSENIIINNEIEMISQSSLMKSLWDISITDVVTRMYELQKIEQESLRKDPLAMLSLNSSRIDMSLLRLNNNNNNSNIKRSRNEDGISISDPVLDKIRKTPRFNTNDDNISYDTCPNCGKDSISKIDVMSSSGNVSKNETWGSKDLPEENIKLYCCNCHTWI